MLKRWRKGAEITQAEAARRLGVSQAAWNEYENGEKVPRVDKASDIATLTGGAVPMEAWAEQERRRKTAKKAAAESRDPSSPKGTS